MLIGFILTSFIPNLGIITPIIVSIARRAVCRNNGSIVNTNGRVSLEEFKLLYPDVHQTFLGVSILDGLQIPLLCY